MEQLQMGLIMAPAVMYCPGVGAKSIIDVLVPGLRRMVMRFTLGAVLMRLLWMMEELLASSLLVVVVVVDKKKTIKANKAVISIVPFRYIPFRCCEWNAFQADLYVCFEKSKEELSQLQAHYTYTDSRRLSPDIEIARQCRFTIHTLGIFSVSQNTHGWIMVWIMLSGHWCRCTCGGWE